MTQQFMRNISGRLIATTEQRIRATLRVFLDRGMVEPQRTVAIFLARGAESDKLDQIEAILKREGWQVRKEKLETLLGVCHRPEKKVTIKQELRGFQRDVTFLHELNHAYLGPTFKDVPAILQKEEVHEACIRSIIIEWAARRARANPRVLHSAVLTFDLEPQIYDHASYCAFHNLEQQMTFAFRGADQFEKYKNQKPQME